MSDPNSPLYEELHAWLMAIRHQAEAVARDQEPQVTNRIERDVLADRAHRAARYLTALADRLELFDA